MHLHSEFVPLYSIIFTQQSKPAEDCSVKFHSTSLSMGKAEVKLVTGEPPKNKDHISEKTKAVHSSKINSAVCLHLPNFADDNHTVSRTFCWEKAGTLTKRS